MSKTIRDMYRAKGINPPDGKGIHTQKFHTVASSIMADNPALGRGRAYRIAMKQLGRDKAVKKSHWSERTRGGKGGGMRGACGKGRLQDGSGGGDGNYGRR